MCGLEIETDGERVTRVRGDRDDVWSKGFLCPKGASLGQLHHDPDRIRVPMVRDGDDWREVTWDEAFARCEELLGAVVAEHGMRRRHRVPRQPERPQLLAEPLLGRGPRPRGHQGHVVGRHRRPVAQEPGVRPALRRRLGHSHPRRGQHRPARDHGRQPAGLQRVAALLPRPHRRAGPHPRPRRSHHRDRSPPHGYRRAGRRVDARSCPGTDAALLLAVVYVLDDGGPGRPGRDRRTGARGRRGARSPPATSRPRRWPTWCGVDAERIRHLARELAGTERAVVYGRIGLCNQEFGTLASWLVEVVNVLTGHFGVEGGALFPRPAVATISSTARRRGPIKTGRWHTRVRGAPEVLGQAPLSCLAEEIDTPGEGQVKALITLAGNPALSAPDAGRLEAALPLLDAMISVDNYLNETSRHAHVILPGLSFLEQPHRTRRSGGSPCVAWPGGRRPSSTPATGPRSGRSCCAWAPSSAACRPIRCDVEALDDEWFVRPGGPPRRGRRHGRHRRPAGPRPDRRPDAQGRAMGRRLRRATRRADPRTTEGAPPRHRLRPVVQTHRRRVAHRIG